MKNKTKIEFLRGGLITSFQGKQVNNMQHIGITTSGPMDYFLSQIYFSQLNKSFSYRQSLLKKQECH